jgi:P-type E1-E2 ATPase
MLEFNIPGFGRLQLNHLVCDVNGTLALDGVLIDGLIESLSRLSQHLELHLVTADTLGRQVIIDQQLGLHAIRLKPGDERAQKAAYVHQLGAEQVVAIGQGANDTEMLKVAALGICILSREGTATSTLLASDLVVPDIITAFDLLENTHRIMATLRQ